MDTHQAEVEEEEEEVMAGVAVAVAAATVATGMHRVVLSAEHCMLSPARLVCCHAVTSMHGTFLITMHFVSLFANAQTALLPDAVLDSVSVSLGSSA